MRGGLTVERKQSNSRKTRSGSRSGKEERSVKFTETESRERMQGWDSCYPQARKSERLTLRGPEFDFFLCREAA